MDLHDRDQQPRLLIHDRDARFSRAVRWRVVGAYVRHYTGQPSTGENPRRDHPRIRTAAALPRLCTGPAPAVSFALFHPVPRPFTESDVGEAIFPAPQGSDE